MSDILSNIQTVTIKIITRNGDEIDLSQQFLLINIWQSLIHKKFINGRIVLSDTSDLISNLPIIGYEQIKISVTNSFDTSNQSYNFRIYKIDRDVNTFKPTQKMKLLNIYLYTEEEFNSYSKISKRFNDLGYNSIQSLITTNLQSTKTLDYEADSTNIDFISNFWNSEKCIDYICKKTQSTYYDYLFYENNNGFNFQSLSYLLTQDITRTLDFNITKEQFSNVDTSLAYQFNTYFDDLNWRKKGMFGSTGFNIDEIKYKYEKLEETLSDIDEKIYHKGLNPMYNEQSDVLSRVYVSDIDSYTSTEKVRPTSLNLVNRYNFIVQLNGDIDRNVGDVYKINFPSIDNESVSGSDSFSGNYLVSEIETQIYQTNEFKQNVSLVKNSLFKNQKLNTY